MVKALSFLDKVLCSVDNFLKTSVGSLDGTGRDNPAGSSLKHGDSQQTEKLEKAGNLMRVNHSGEVAAQGLYQGQLFFENNAAIVDYLRHAAKEEADHLRWTEEYLRFASSRKSYLNPLWYWGGFSLGLYMQQRGPEKSKSFLAETERQVQNHLKKQIDLYSEDNLKARDILNKMYEDEGLHADWAETNLERHELTFKEKFLMKIFSKVMVIVSEKV